MSEASSIKESAVSFLQLVATGKTQEAFDKYAAAGFRHHNPWFRGDAESLRVAMQENADKNPGKALEVQHAIQEGALVAVHSRVQHSPEGLPAAVVHIFRFEGPRIAELWDVGQMQPEDMANEYGMF